MEYLLNELSLNPLCDDKYEANERMNTFVKTVSLARQNGFRNIRSDLYTNEIILAQDYSLHNWMFNKNDVPEVQRNLMVGMIINPFIKDEDEQMTDEYILSNYYFEDEEHGIEKTKCLGLAGAYLYETLSISMPSLPVWEKTSLPVIIEDENEVRIENVLNVANEQAFSDSTISSFIENSKEITLTETLLTHNQKKIHLADHHGKAELQALCDRIKHNEYVIEMRSTEWCRGRCDKFIKKIHNNGFIEIVLYKEAIKYALLVKTTGNSYRETKKISEILEQKYS